MNADEYLTRVEGLAAAATEGPTLTRYDHGGGRLAVFDGDRRALVADFYDEGDREFYTASRDAVPRMAAALRAVLDLHRPMPPERGGLVSWTYCSCGTTSVTTRIDGHPSIAPVAHEDCPTVRAITSALDGAS